MSLPMANQNEKSGDGHEGHAASHDYLPTGNDVNMEVEEEDEEDEDVDFNPFLRADISEASSSLSSEDEGVCNTAEISIDISPNGKDASSIPMDETQSAKQESEVGDHSGNHNANCLTKEEALQEKPMTEAEDEEDAICRRTRARQSLANYTLEELETFLQESDDEANPPNINDEEEYRKFLAAVLLGGVDEGQAGQEEGPVDEDEEDDADFELEIEEALESDADEDVDWDKRQVEKAERDAHTPETRQKKHLKESSKDKKYVSKMPLRPILPDKRHDKTAPLPSHRCQPLFPKSSSLPAANVSSGFTAHQLGQLYCLIHEHVQLLIQVFSISVLDPSRQPVANDVKKMMLEMNARREEALSQRKLPYPRYCFQPPNLFSSTQSDFHQTANCSHWTPFLQTHSVLSILDVAPLQLVKSYVADVSDTVIRYRQRYLQDVPDENLSTKVPLFPLPLLPSPTDIIDNVSGRNTSTSSNRHSTLPHLPGQVQSKKSLATLIVETTKKQSVAPVPKDIATSAQRFCPLFNSALFPHKPPAPAIVSRVLFTDAEDGLLAMGIMDYNNDWLAIQQHYLPCKSTHQIFVRQKNRSSSKAPENTIKAVRRMKTSPLSAHEQACISEGLRLFKHDWSLVWKFFLPHRDPSLLPRQWRIANGTQISYKKSEASKQKRRAYENKRRKLKSIGTDCQMSLEKEDNDGEDKSGDDMDGEEDVAYVHEAFVEDSERGSSKSLSYDNLPIINRRELQAVDMMPCYKGSYSNDHCDSVTNECVQFQQESEHELLNSSLQDVQRPSQFPHISCGTSSKSVSCFSYHPLVEHPYRKRVRKGARVVKLAPDLPPVNLPSSVRVISQSVFSVISQSSFKSYENKPSCSKIQANVVKSSRVPQLSKLGRSISTPEECLSKYSNTRSHQDEGFLGNSFGAEENTSDSDLRMHPLLFQASESLYLSKDHHSTSSIYNFFPGHPFQGDTNLIHQRPVTSIDHNTSHLEGPSNLCTIDFHPLLQRESDTMPSVSRQSGELRTMQGSCEKSYNPSGNILIVPRVGEGQVASSTASLRLHEKENNLDLSIQLSSAPDKESAGGCVMNEQQNVKKGLYADMPFLNCSDNHPEALVKNESAVKSLTRSQNDILSSEIIPGNGGTCQNMIDLQDESIRGIVMEQEELSDSEEEIEHVEFECEEIDDSDEDEIGCGQPEIQNKDSVFFNSKRENTKSTDILQPSQSRSLKGGSVGKGDHCTSTPQISQVSCHARSSRLKAQQDNSAKEISPCKDLANVPPSRPGRSRKKQSAESSRRQPSKADKCKAIGYSKRPRKHSLSTHRPDV